MRKLMKKLILIPLLLLPAIATAHTTKIFDSIVDISKVVNASKVLPLPSGAESLKELQMVNALAHRNEPARMRRLMKAYYTTGKPVPLAFKGD